MSYATSVFTKIQTHFIVPSIDPLKTDIFICFGSISYTTITSNLNVPFYLISQLKINHQTFHIRKSWKLFPSPKVPHRLKFLSAKQIQINFFFCCLRRISLKMKLFNVAEVSFFLPKKPFNTFPSNRLPTLLTESSLPRAYFNLYYAACHKHLKDCVKDTFFMLCVEVNWSCLETSKWNWMECFSAIHDYALFLSGRTNRHDEAFRW